MRTQGFGGWAVLLAASLVVSTAFAADDDDAPKKEPTWKFGRTGKFGKAPPKPEPKKPDPPKEKEEPLAVPQVSIAVRRERESNAYLRRMDACYRLMEIANANNDEEMQRKVEELQERVWAVYQKNTDNAEGRPVGADEVTLRKGPLNVAGREKP